MSRDGTEPAPVTGSGAPRRILLVAGEASGDLHAANLIAEIRSLVPDVVVRGIGGRESRAEGMETIIDSAELSTMGLTELGEKARVIFRAYRELRREIRSGRPDLLVLVDFPEFNLALARVAKRAGVPVFYYISPQVWAWRRGRVRKILRRVDRLAAVFPFEPEVYGHSPKVAFVGHPLVDRVRTTRTRAETLVRHGLDPDVPLVTLLPGSRRREIEGLLPSMARAASILARDRRVQFALGLASTIPEDFARGFLDGAGVEIPVVDGDAYNLIAASRLVLASSGTVTLETALLGTPMVLMYRLSRTSYVLGKIVVRIPHIGMPNVIAGREIVPELIQGEASSEGIAERAAAILDDPEEHRRIVADLAAVREALGSGGAAAKAARLAVELFR